MTWTAGAVRLPVAIAQNPSQIAGLWGWWKADALALTDGTAVSSWTDSSGNGNTLLQATGANQPIFHTAIVNGQPAVLFDGSNDFLSVAAAAGMTGNLSLFVVCKTTDALNNYTPLSARTGTNGWIFRVTPTQELYGNIGATPNIVENLTPTNWNLMELVRTGVNAQPYVNGSAGTGATLTANPTATSSTFVGGETSGLTNNFKGYIAEIMIYTTAVSDADRVNGIESYVTSKYGFAA